MSADYSTQEPSWEMTEDNWRGSASLDGRTLKWHAYVEPLDALGFRTWAGRSFDSLTEAQTWCRKEIARQRRQAPPPAPAPIAPPPEAWSWLWKRLDRELGANRVAALQAELAQWVRERRG